MAEMTFFSKTGNPETNRQRKQLQLAGNELHCRDILRQKWTRKKLLPFVRGRDPLQIMDSSAVEIRKGDIDPVLITFDEAVDLMIASPELIKGPLVEVDGLSIQGFEDSRLRKYLGEEAGLTKKMDQHQRYATRLVSRKTQDQTSFWSQFYQGSFA